MERYDVTDRRGAGEGAAHCEEKYRVVAANRIIYIYYSKIFNYSFYKLCLVNFLVALT